MRSDAQLLAEWRDGDQDAGDELIGRHFASICRFFRSKLGDDVEDLVQRTFLGCVEARDRVSDDGFRAYLFGIARNRLYKHLRQAYQRPDIVDLGSHSIADLGTSPSGLVAKNQQEQLLLRAMQLLPLDYQIALELTYWEGLRGRDVARVLDIAENTVRSRLSRARDALRAQVEKLSSSPLLAASTMEQFDSVVAAG